MSDYPTTAVRTRSIPAIKLAGWAMSAVGIAGYIIWLLNAGLVKDGNWVGVDFHVYYQAAQVLRRGGDIYHAGISPVYIYPPLLAILVVPLAALQVNAATITWKVLQHICLLLAGGLLVNMAPRGWRSFAAGLLCLCLLTAPLHDEIRLGESNSLVLLLVAGTLRSVNRAKALETGGATRRWYLLAADLLALAVSIKVLPVLLLAYFCWRGPRFVALAATVAFFVLQLISLAITPTTLDYWFVQFPGLFGQAFPFLDNQSINALLSRALLPTDPGLPTMQIADREGVRVAATWAANLLALGATLLVLRRSRGKRAWAGNLLLEAGLVLLTIHVVSGSTWMHHLVDIAVPVIGLVWLWTQGQSQPGVKAAAAVLAAVGFLLLLRSPAGWVQTATDLAPANPALALVASGTGLWAVIALWIAVAVSLLVTKDERRGQGAVAADFGT